MHLLSLSAIFMLAFEAVICEDTQCSKFHYEEQTLEKMIRMEGKVEALEKVILETNQQVLESLEAVKSERAQFATEFQQIKDTVRTSPVGFKARTVLDTSIETEQKIIFTTNMFNVGEAYDNVTGIFTAPVAGIYVFTIHICTPGSIYFNYGIVVDNIVHTGGRFYETNTACNAVDAVLSLHLGQRVWVKCIYNGSTSANLYEYTTTTSKLWNTFSGALIQKSH